MKMTAKRCAKCKATVCVDEKGRLCNYCECPNPKVLEPIDADI